MANINWNKLDTQLPVVEINKGHIKDIPLNQAFGNAKAVVSPRLNYQPLPNSIIVPSEG
jgi:hypothetical protein